MSTLLSQPTIHHTAAESQPDGPVTLATLEPVVEPLLLEYHAEADPDIHYIPKVTGCFAAGALCMGICLNILAIMIHDRGADPYKMVYSLVLHMAFVFGITGVGSSLVLVGLKVRDDHTAAVLYARHWLASLATGAAFSMIVWGPWLVAERGVSFNRFVAAAIWMAVMAFPGVSALWTVGPHKSLARA
jgi:hypothetical protein